MPSNDTTNIRVLSIAPSRKSNALADAIVEIHTEAGTIEIRDCRVLRNRADECWMSLPSFAIPEGKSYHYEATVVLSRELKQLVSNAVLAAYEQWAERKSSDVISAAEIMASGGAK